MHAGFAFAFGPKNWVEGIEQTYEVQYSLSDGSTPLWLNANRYGLSSLASQNGYVRAVVERPLAVDSLRTVDIGFGADVVLPVGYTSDVVLQQCFVEARYRHGVLTLGQQEQPMQLRHQQLSSGAQALGINARPVPGVRVTLPSYYEIPGTHRWLGIKGHLFYGWLTDGDWQQRWTSGQYRYDQGSLLHTKAGYLRVGPRRIFWSVQTDLLQVSDLNYQHEEYIFRFEYEADALRLYDPYQVDHAGSDMAVSDPEVLRMYGINALDESFFVERIDKKQMRLRNQSLRLYFNRY